MSILDDLLTEEQKERIASIRNSLHMRVMMGEHTPTKKERKLLDRQKRQAEKRNRR